MKNSSQSRGSSLIETMIAVLIALIGVFGMGQVIFQATAVNKNQGTETTRAVIYAQDKLEKLLSIGTLNGVSSANFASCVQTATGMTFTVIGGGSFAAGAYYFEPTFMDTATPANESLPGAEVSLTLAAGQAVQVTGTLPPNASAIRVYVGTSSGSENQYFSSTTLPLTVTSSTGTGGSPPLTTSYTIASGCNTTGITDTGWNQGLVAGGAMSPIQLTCPASGATIGYMDFLDSNGVQKTGSCTSVNSAPTSISYIRQWQIQDLTSSSTPASFTGGPASKQLTVAVYSQAAVNTAGGKPIVVVTSVLSNPN